MYTYILLPDRERCHDLGEDGEVEMLKKNVQKRQMQLNEQMKEKVY